MRCVCSVCKENVSFFQEYNYWFIMVLLFIQFFLPYTKEWRKKRKIKQMRNKTITVILFSFHLDVITSLTFKWKTILILVADKTDCSIQSISQILSLYVYYLPMVHLHICVFVWHVINYFHSFNMWRELFAGVSNLKT